MSSEDSAFPVQRQLREDGEVIMYGEVGLTKLEYAAIQIAAGMCANHGSYGSNNGPGEIACRAVMVARALMAELAKVKS